MEEDRKMPVTLPDVKKTWPNTINTVTLGATKDEGGTRMKKVTVGGATALPFHHFEARCPILRRSLWRSGTSLPKIGRMCSRSTSAMSGAIRGLWAKKCVEQYGADLICLRLAGCDPVKENRGPQEAAQAVKRVLESVGVPLIVWGTGNDDKDNEIFPAVAEAAAGENCLLGTITEDNYKTLVALCTAYKHKVIAESPCDVNIAKQVNILATDMGFKPEDIVIYPTSAALGYGLEYVYSVMERARLAALRGDKMLSQPMICDIGIEVWGVKEAKASERELPEWGEQKSAARCGRPRRPMSIFWRARISWCCAIQGRRQRARGDHTVDGRWSEMILIGERINGSFKDIAQAIKERNKAPIQEWARRQTEAGADYLDVNLGAVSKSADDFRWLIQTVCEAVPTPISVDYNKLDLMKAGLEAYREFGGGRPVIINSTTAEDSKLIPLVELAMQYNAGLIGVVMDERGSPQDVDRRVELGSEDLCCGQRSGADSRSHLLGPNRDAPKVYAGAGEERLGSDSTVRDDLRSAAAHLDWAEQYLLQSARAFAHQSDFFGDGDGCGLRRSDL
jgi:acetyl-CoA decarbonylase/synthase complex subunit delta